MADLTKAELQKQLDEASKAFKALTDAHDATKAELEAAKAEIAKLKGDPAAAPATAAVPWPPSLILSRAELEALTLDQQNAFRTAGGTCTE